MKFYLLSLLSLISISLSAQNDTIKIWDKGASLGLNFSQIHLENWAGGGINSVSFTSLSTLFLNYNKGNNSWINTLDLGYGVIRAGEESEPFKKSDDKIIFLSKYGFQQSKWVKYSALLDIRTQFAPGYAYSQDSLEREERTLISDFMAPGFVITALGAEIGTSDKILVFISPLTVKSTFVLNPLLASQGAFGVEPGNKYRKEIGAYFNATAKLNLMENITYKSLLNLFSNYENPLVIDVFWENLLFLKVNKYVNINISTTLIYDQDIEIIRENRPPGPAIQFKEVLNLGVSFNLR